MLTVAVIAGAAFLLMRSNKGGMAFPEGFEPEGGAGLGDVKEGTSSAPPPNISGTISGVAGALAAFLTSTGIGVPLAAVVTAVGAALSWFSDEAWRSQYAAETYRKAYNELLAEGERQGIRGEVAQKLDATLLALYVDIMKRPVGFLMDTNAHLVFHLNMATDGLLGNPVTRAGAPKGAIEIQSFVDRKWRVYAPNGQELDMISNAEADAIEAQQIADYWEERMGLNLIEELADNDKGAPTRQTQERSETQRKVGTSFKIDRKTGAFDREFLDSDIPGPSWDPDGRGMLR